MYLKDYLKKMDISQAKFSQQIGVKQNTISRWINNCMFPSNNHMLKIINVTGGAVNYEDFAFKNYVSPKVAIINMIDEFMLFSGENYGHFCSLLKIAKTSFYRKMQFGFTKDEIVTIKLYIQEKRKELLEIKQLYNEIYELLDKGRISVKWMAISLNLQYDALKRRLEKQTLLKSELKKILREYDKINKNRELNYESY